MICTDCGKEKEPYREKRRLCRDCRNIRLRRPKTYTCCYEKKCSKCKKVKTFREFHRMKGAATGLTCKCA